MITIPHLETNVATACQLRCVSCNHFVPMQVPQARENMATAAQMESDLGHLARVLRADAYGMLGGEPLLHPRLPDLLAVSRASGISGRVEVWTNGIRVRRMGREFWRAADGRPAFERLVVSVYPGTLDDAELGWIAGRCRDEGVELVVKDERAVPNFERLLEPAPTGPEATAKKYRACFFKGFSRVVDRGVFYRCCTSPFIPKLLLGLPEGTDGIPVAGITEEALRTFLAREAPMASCTICAGLDPHDRHHMRWTQVRDAEEWRRASAGAGA
jgi:hypothetical protein